jgi:hypothetical protein
MRGRTSPELLAGHLFKVTADEFGGRKYLICEVREDRVLALEGWFEYKVQPNKASPEDTWAWSQEGWRWFPRSHFSWSRDVGRIPEVGEPRFRFRWGMEAG